MAPPVDVNESLTFKIDVIAKSLADLPSILDDQKRGELGENERIALAQEWGADMGTLRVVLDPAYRTGQMTPEQQARYRELLGRLKEALPILDQLGFSRPPVSLDLAA